MSMDTNNFVIIGRLTRDIGSDERSFAYLPNGQARANVSIAVNHSRKNGDQWIDEVDYFDVTIWGKAAENLKPYLLKGVRVSLVGHLRQERWEKDGHKMSRVVLAADHVQLLSGKPENGGGQMDSPAGHYVSMGSSGNNDSGFPEDIPF
jgi:single-strand DNA-binding protein